MKQNLAKLVTKESVLKALQRFESEDHNLINSSKYDLEYKGNFYPPKEVVREAARIQGINASDEIHTLSGGDKTNIFLKNMGFPIVSKGSTPRTINKLEKYWKDYKDYFKLPKSEHQEKYKWEVLKQVYQKWDWNAEDLPKMFKEAFEVSGKKNLWLSGNFFPIGHTNWMFDNFKDETINQFNNLFDESLPLINRIENFVTFYDEKLLELRKLVPDKKINFHSHKDLRAIALYLTLQYPEKYFLFKFTMYKNYSFKLDLPKIKTGDNHNLINFTKLANHILDFIKKDSEFLKIYKQFTSEDVNYKDESLHLLTQDFMYTVANHFNEDKKYWRVGSNDGTTSYYTEMLNENYIAIGWNEIGDLEQQEVDSKVFVQDLLQEVDYGFGSQGVLTRKSGEIFDFFTNAKNDDIVTLMDGNTVLAIGKIVSDYSYDDSKPLMHCRHMEWLKKDLSNFTINDGTQTSFYPLTKAETIKKIENELNNTSSLIKSTEMVSNIKSNIPLNQILYGAPGTGKTYNTKKLAVEIIEHRQFGDTKEEREEILRLYDQYYELKQIRFTTFHQSLGYEDFIEGIKPKLGGATSEEVEYEVRDGIFKLICSDANELKTSSNFDDSYNKFVEEVMEQGHIELKSLSKGKPFDVRVNSNQNCIAIPHTETRTNIVITKKMIEEYIVNDKIIDWKTYVTSIGEFIKSKYHITVQNSDNRNKNYVLIMDEINRGNVSSIFGELITLIEDDKRKGSKEVITVDLPYSQTKFSVPDNVYLIGTMNTADRSVEALDTALRRRFSFTEMKSDPQVLLSAHENRGTIPETNINLISLLETINKRIELLVDKDHQIGHSYFISVNSLDDLKYTFKNKIIPLLEEYFYGDFGKIGLVLGDRFVTASAAHENKKILANFKGYDDVDFLTDKKIYEFLDIDLMNSSDFISIYQSVTVSANNEF